MDDHLTFQQQKSMAELITAVVYQFVGWVIALIAVVLGASKDWLVWVPAVFMLVGVLMVRASIALGSTKDPE